MKRRRALILIGADLIMVGLMLSPLIYREYVVARLQQGLDQKCGHGNWAVVWMNADLQSDQKIHPMRTLYVRFLYPWMQDYTPWKGLQFTHKTSASVRPWHFVVCVVAPEHEITCFWSMKQNKWVEVWNNRLDGSAFANMQPDIVDKDGINWLQQGDEWVRNRYDAKSVCEARQSK